VLRIDTHVPQRISEDLTAETDAEHRHARADSIGHEILIGNEIRMCVLVVGTNAPTEQHDAVMVNHIWAVLSIGHADDIERVPEVRCSDGEIFRRYCTVVLEGEESHPK
jgi:hypothetical protein